MDLTVPGYLTPFILTGMVGVITAVLFGLNRAVRRTNAAEKQLLEKDGTPVFWGVSSIIVVWFVAAFATSVAGFYRPASGPPTIEYGLFIPIVAGLFVYLAWPALRRVLASIPNTWLVGVQFYRALGIIFLILYADGKLPGLFALPAGVADVLVGIFAPFVAGAYARSPESAARRVRLWNLLGIADLVIAVTIGFLTSPSPLQVAAFDRPNVLIGMFPLVLIPVFAVPLSILLHIASLRKLAQDRVTLGGAKARQQISRSAQQAIS